MPKSGLSTCSAVVSTLPDTFQIYTPVKEVEKRESGAWRLASKMIIQDVKLCALGGSPMDVSGQQLSNLSFYVMLKF